MLASSNQDPRKLLMPQADGLANLVLLLFYFSAFWQVPAFKASGKAAECIYPNAVTSDTAEDYG